jgi:hypothetical protein
MSRIAVLIAVPLAVAIALPGVVAANEEDVSWKREARELDFVSDTGGFSFSSLRDSDRGSDRIAGAFDLASATFRYELVSTEAGNASFVQMDVAFARVVEFEDRDGDGRYGLGDREVQAFELGLVEGATLSVSPIVTGDRYTATATYPLKRSGGGPLPVDDDVVVQGGLRLVFDIAAQGRFVDDIQRAPTFVKFDVRLDEFPYLENSTRTAVVTQVEATQALDADADSLSARNGSFEVVYGWLPAAEVDGALVPVGVTVLPDVDATQVAFAYGRGTVILHDPWTTSARFAAPEVPTVLAELVDGDWMLFGIGTLLTGILVGGPMVHRLRRRP